MSARLKFQYDENAFVEPVPPRADDAARTRVEGLLARIRRRFRRLARLRGRPQRSDRVR